MLVACEGFLNLVSIQRFENPFESKVQQVLAQMRVSWWKGGHYGRLVSLCRRKAQECFAFGTFVEPDELCCGEECE